MIQGTYIIATPLIGNGARQNTVIDLVTASVADFGLDVMPGASIHNLTINRDCQDAAITNSRSNLAILIGSHTDKSTGGRYDIKIDGVTINSTMITPNTRPCNAMGLINDVYDTEISNLDISGDALIYLIAHWNYNATGDRTNHPRRISFNNIKVSGNGGDGMILSGCHDIRANGLYFDNVDRGLTISAGDQGGGSMSGDYPADESIDRVMSNINIRNLTVQNSVNEGILLFGASYPQNLTTNERWISINSPNQGILIDGYSCVRGAASTSCEGIIARLVQNVTVKDMAFGDRYDRTENAAAAIVVDASNNGRYELNTSCLCAVNGISGRNNVFNINYTGNDANYSSAQNALALKGALTNATTNAAVAIGDTTIQLTLTCHIHPGMKFTHGGNVFEFTTGAYYDVGTPAFNTTIVGIRPAVAAIASGQTIVQHYGMQDTHVTGHIKNAHKGIRVQFPQGFLGGDMLIDSIFQNSNSCDVQVDNGHLVRIGGTYYMDNQATPATYTVKDGIPSLSTVIMFNKVGTRRIGYGAAAPVTGTWADGDIIYNNAPTSTTQGSGWQCTTPGAPGTWTAL